MSAPSPRKRKRDRKAPRRRSSIVAGFPDRGADYHVEVDQRGNPVLVLHEGTTSDAER